MTYAEYKITIRVLCKVFGGSTTSGIRTTSRNSDVGGSPRSKHLTGMADDVVLDDMAELYRDGFVVAARKAGLWVLDEGDHIHVQGKAPTRGSV